MPDQLPLFRHRLHQRLHDRIIARLLWMANTRPPAVHRREFYDLKDRLLHRYAIAVGEDIQRIRKVCWDCDGSGVVNGRWISEAAAYSLAECDRCDGTGIYNTIYVALKRWDFAGYVFHQPQCRLYKLRPGDQVAIEGYVQHANLKGHRAKEAQLWLALLCDRRLFWRMLTRGGCALGWYGLPMCNVQRAVYVMRDVRLWWRWRPRRCQMCGCRLWPWRRYGCDFCSPECYESIPF